MRKGNRTAKVPVSVLPTPEEAVDAYQQTGGQLTLFPKFGSDPLDGHSDLQDARHIEFVSSKKRGFFLCVGFFPWVLYPK